MERLLTYLKQTPEGKIADTAKLEELLAGCWEELVGDYGGMEPHKLLWRMEDVLWRPPMLEFAIERHGGKAMGSSRAELQHWKINVENKTIIEDIEGYRQISPVAAPLDIKPIAKEIIHLILNRKKDERLKWSRKGNVQVRTGKILPRGSAVKQTLSGRRSRLRYAIKERLAAHGWQEISHSWYAPPKHAG